METKELPELCRDEVESVKHVIEYQFSIHNWVACAMPKSGLCCIWSKSPKISLIRKKIEIINGKILHPFEGPQSPFGRFFSGSKVGIDFSNLKKKKLNTSGSKGEKRVSNFSYCSDEWQFWRCMSSVVWRCLGQFHAILRIIAWHFMHLEKQNCRIASTVIARYV